MTAHKSSETSELTTDNLSLYDTVNEAFSNESPVCLEPVPLPVNNLDVVSHDRVPSSLPLCFMLNARSIFNKRNNLIDLLHSLRPDICLVSETFESKNRSVKEIFENSHYKSLSYKRTNRAPGGGCAIVYNDTRFDVSEIAIEAPKEIETVWGMFIPKQSTPHLKVSKIAVGSYYISPRSNHKQATIDNIIETIHSVRAQYDNDVKFLIGGDFNKTDITDILDSYGAMHQVVTQPTRNDAILEILLTDLATLYHPPTSIAPLQVDDDKLGEDSDHNIVVFAPKDNLDFKTEKKWKIVKTRPLPESKMIDFENQIGTFEWEEALENKTVNEQVELFHRVLRTNLDIYFPEKTVKMSNLDKKWMTPELKQIHRKLQREYYKNRKSEKYKSLKSKYKKRKRSVIKDNLRNFVTELKHTAPGKWFFMAKKIGAIGNKPSEVTVESLKNLSNTEAANSIANHFSVISNEYLPIQNADLPAYLPALPPPQLDERAVYQELKSIKKTKTTLPIDIPEKLRRECDLHLAAPLTMIYNNCLNSSVYPSLWKHEWVTPAPKITNPQGITDLRKIS